MKNYTNRFQREIVSEVIGANGGLEKFNEKMGVPIPSSTVDLEREALQAWINFTNSSLQEVNFVSFTDGYKIARQTTSQKGLDELIDTLNACKENGFKDIDIDFVITKATELLTKK